MTNPITGVATTGYQYPQYNYGLYNPTNVDMETTMATGYNPTTSMGLGMDYGIFNSQGYASPYNLGYDSFSYGGGLGYGTAGMGYGGMYGYGYSPAMMQAMVQSQILALDGQKLINGKQREMGYDGQIADMNYQTKLTDAKDTNHEDTVRRDTNFKNACDKINERLEAKDTQAALDAYNYALSLMAKVYDDVDDKRSSETPSERAAIKAAFERKYQEVYGQSFKDKIKDCLPGAFNSGFQSELHMQEIMSEEEMLSFVDDRPVAFNEEAHIYKSLGRTTVTAAPYAAVGTGAGAAAGWGIGKMFKSPTSKIGQLFKGHGGKIGGTLGLITGTVIAFSKAFNKD